MGLSWSDREDDSVVLHNLYGSSAVFDRPRSNFVAVNALPDGQPWHPDEDGDEASSDEDGDEFEDHYLGVRYRPPALGHSADEEAVDDPPTDTDPWPINRRAPRVPQDVPNVEPYRPRIRHRDRRAQPGSTRLVSLR